MSKQTKDLVAAAHQAFAMDEISLKQLAILFNRITIQGLWLAELGIRFEIEKEKLNVSDNDDYKKAFTLILEDANEILHRPAEIGCISSEKFVSIPNSWTL